MTDKLAATEPADSISPLPGEPGIPSVGVRMKGTLSGKGLLAVALMLVMILAVLGVSIQQFTASSNKAGDGSSQQVSDQPAAARRH